MSETVEFLNKNKYVVLTGAVEDNERQALVEHLFKLKEDNLTVKDEQCPLSDSIYGDRLFEELALRLAPQLSIHAGKKLIPTYTYARIYRTGEVLKPHVDRESCEYSATLCLDYDAEASWPIFFENNKGIQLTPGELILYKGCEITHSRPAFKGNWHAQVFLHYVDENGPFKDWVDDKRELRKREANHFFKPLLQFNSIIIPPVSDDLPGYFCIDKEVLPELKLSDDECDKVISFADKNYSVPGSIGTSGPSGLVDKIIRSVNIYDVPLNSGTEWLYSKISAIISFTNNNYYRYDIAGIVHNLQLMEYTTDLEVNGHYDWHVDVGNKHLSLRKISLTIQLSNSNEYEGCELLINNHGNVITATKERGSVHLFPSYLLHKVNPIQRGKRYSLVLWVHGSNRFR